LVWKTEIKDSYVQYCSTWYLLYDLQKMNANVCILLMYPRELVVL
jgi:hypothetical protein